MAKDKGCYQCPDRHYACWSSCEKHQKKKAADEALKALIRAKKEEEQKLDRQALIARARARKEKLPRN